MTGVQTCALPIYFIETFVWDSDAVALAAPGKTVSVILVTP